MKRTISLFFILAFILSGILLLSGFIPANTVKGSSVNSSAIEFKIKNAGFTVEGAFSGLNAKISFDASDLAGSNIEATISTKTINTGNKTRDGHLRAEKYFDVAKYASISLKSNSFSKQGNDSYIGRFKLTIKETTKDIAIPFSYTEKEGVGVFKSSFTIDRRDYGVGGSSMVMADNVTIMIEVNVLKKYSMLQQTSGKHLLELKSILVQLSDADYSKPLSILDNGTLGKHVRHILEFYECLLFSRTQNIVCYDDRQRNLVLEEDIKVAADFIDAIIDKVTQIDCNRSLVLQSRFNGSMISMESSLYREITYNIEHTVHHLAIIRIALTSEFRHINLSKTFGYADSTIQFIQAQKVA